MIGQLRTCLRGIALAPTTAMAVAAAASAQGFTDGDLYLFTRDYPGASGDALVHIDPVTGAQALLIDGTLDSYLPSGLTTVMTYDPGSDRIVIPTNLPSRTLFFVDSTGAIDEQLYYGAMPGLINVPASGLASSCDGRLFLYGGRYFGWIDPDHATGGMITTDGTTPLELVTSQPVMLYDAGTNSLFVASPGASRTDIARIPLSADGRRSAGPIDVVSYDAGYVYGEQPVSLSRGPAVDALGGAFANGTIFVKVDVNEDARYGQIMFLFDPVTLQFFPFSPGDQWGAGSTVATWNSTYGWAAALSTGPYYPGLLDSVRTWSYDPVGPAAPQPLALDVSSPYGSHEAAALIAIGDTIGGICAPANQAPSIVGDVGPYFPNEGELFQLLATVSDPDGDFVVVDDSGLLPGMTATPLSGTGGFDVLISWIPTAANDVGFAQDVCLVASDPSGAEATFCFTIADVNQRPVADAGVDLGANEGALVALDGSGSADADGDLIALTWSQVSGPSVVLDTSDPLHPTFVAPAVGSEGAILTFDVVAFDGALTSDPDFVNVTVVNVNHPPVADAGADQFVNEGTLVTLDASGSYDADGEALQFVWSQLSGTPVALDQTDPLHPTFVAPLVTSAGETLDFVLLVDDGLDVAMDVVAVTVENVNHAPLADAGDTQAVSEGSLVALDGSSSSDPDGDALLYVWTQVAGTPVALDLSDPARPTFVAPDVASSETLSFELVVDDGLALSAASTVTITVLDESSPPVCDNAEARIVGDDGELSSDNVIWPPNHALLEIAIIGIADESDLDVTITIERVTQDEPLNGAGDGDTDQDAVVNQDGVLLLRAERTGGGDGRVYVVEFTATNSDGESCSGSVEVIVPHSKRSGAVDSGQTVVSYDR